MKDQEKLQELQELEQTLQNVLMQKQAFQMEIAETEAATSELKKSDGEVFKIIGQLMIKSDIKKTKDEFEEKQKLLNMRLKNLDKQESTLTEKLQKIREEFMKYSKN
jgi:prefoldin beta subunit